MNMSVLVDNIKNLLLRYQYFIYTEESFNIIEQELKDILKDSPSITGCLIENSDNSRFTLSLNFKNPADETAFRLTYGLFK